jgi:hypothetical protein
LAPYVAIHAIGVRPIGLYSNCRESLFENEPLGNLGPFPVELVGAMRGFAEQNQTSMPDEIEQMIVILVRAPDGTGGFADQVFGDRQS